MTIYVVSPNGEQQCAGEYVLIPERKANGQPIWKQAGGNYWLYSGDKGMWIIGGSDAAALNFECSRGMLFCKILHGGQTPDKFSGSWLRLDGETFVEDDAITVSQGIVQPRALCVVSPNGQHRCAGEYVLVAGEMVNGLPLWKQRGGKCFLYSGTNGSWIIGGNDAKEKDFKCSRGVIYSKRSHGGLMPEAVGCVWLRLSGEKFHEDASILVSIKPLPLYVRSPNGQQRCSGEYVPVADKMANGQPLWEHIGGKCWLYSGSNGMWIIGGNDAKEKDFQCTRGVIYCKTAHGGLTPDKMFGVWLRLEGETFREDAAISVSTQPQTIYVRSPLGQQKCAGEYALASEELVNGQPIWKQKRGICQLYSSSSGKWTISCNDVKEKSKKAKHEVITVRCETPHNGTMPDKVGSVWFRLDGDEFREDTAIAVTTVIHKPPRLHVVSPNGQQKCAGEYVLVAGETANGQPLWKQMGGKSWLYSGTNGMWIIGGSGAKDKNFECSRGVIYSDILHGGLMPDRIGSSWLRLDGEAFREDTDITITK